MLLRVVEQPRAEAHPVIVVLQYLEIPASLASFPEFRVVSQFRKGHRPEPEFIVHLHHGSPCGYAEYLCIGEQFARKPEYALLDSFRQPEPPERMRHNQS